MIKSLKELTLITLLGLPTFVGAMQDEGALTPRESETPHNTNRSGALKRLRETDLPEINETSSPPSKKIKYTQLSLQDLVEEARHPGNQEAIGVLCDKICKGEVSYELIETINFKDILDFRNIHSLTTEQLYGILPHVPGPQWPNDIITLLQTRAEQGDVLAQYSLGELYAVGKECPPDFEAAVYWLTQAAQQGDAHAQYQLGFMHFHGRGCPRDFAIAVKWSTLAAQQGNVNAQYSLGMMLLNGTGCTQKLEEAYHWLTLAARQGNVNAQYSLGMMLRHGTGCTQNLGTALYWYTQAAQRGNANAQNDLGMILLQGEVCPQDFEAALYWFTEAAQRGNADAQYSLGEMLLHGTGCTQNLESALYWFTEAAQRGNADAPNNLGVMFLQGTGCPQDLEAALYWFTQAAERGNVEGQNNLGMMLLQGQLGSKNYPEALKWLIHAAQQGASDAKDTIKSFFTTIDKPLVSAQLSEQATKDIDLLKSNLNNLRDYHILFQGFAGGTFEYGLNSYLFKISREIDQLSLDYLHLLSQIEEPGFLVSCLEISPTIPCESKDLIAHKKSLAEVCVNLGSDHPTYISLRSTEKLELLRTPKLPQKLSELLETYTISYNLLTSMVADHPDKFIKKIKKAMPVVKMMNPTQYEFLMAYLHPYQAAKDETNKKTALANAIKKIEEDKLIVEEHLEAFEEINKDFVEIIKASQDYQNHLFLTKVWN